LPGEPLPAMLDAPRLIVPGAEEVAMSDDPLPPYRRLIDQEIGFCWDEHFPAYQQHYRILIFGRGPDRPYVVLARNALRRGCGSLEFHARDAALEVYLELGVPLECVVWVNWLPGPRGSYSRRAERFAYIDLWQPQPGYLDCMATYPTTRREVERRLGLKLPVEPARDEPLPCYSSTPVPEPERSWDVRLRRAVRYAELHDLGLID
jgi:hypothetical protein